MAEDDELIRREWRIALILLGLATLIGGLLFGFMTKMVLGVSYAHDSSPTPEFRAAGDAKMLLALLLVLTGVACLFIRRAKHAVIVALMFGTVAFFVGIALWREKESDRFREQGYVRAVP